MMKKIILSALLVLLIFPTFLNAQSRIIANDQIFELQREKFMRSAHNDYDQIEGTPYLYEDFRDGIVYLITGGKITGQYRFDVYKNQFQYMDGDKLMVFAYPDSIAKIEIGANVFKYLPYMEDSMMKKGYFEEIVNGYCGLYKKFSKEFYEAKPAKPYQEPEPPVLRDGKDIYYIRLGDQNPQKIGKKKEFISSWGEQGVQIEKYMKDKKLGLKKEFDLASIIGYINTMFN